MSGKPILRGVLQNTPIIFKQSVKVTRDQEGLGTITLEETKGMGHLI